MGVNGYAVSDLKGPGDLISDMHARNGTDHPATVLWALVGNDVCDHAHDFEHMTKPSVFRNNTLHALKRLDELLAPGSHVIIQGLIDGRVLYDTMHAITHPVGVPYSDFYAFLNCLETSPCWGWMNDNATVRETTWQHAQALNQVYVDVVKSTNGTFHNFELYYRDPDFDSLFKGWANEGYAVQALIEPVDGFHPSQTGNMLWANDLWNWIADVVCFSSILFLCL